MKRRPFILVVAVLGLVLVLLALKIVFLLTAKPKITVDYVAEYNKFARPQNYDPNDNASPYYQKAFDEFVIIPEGLPIELLTSYKGSLSDFNNSQQVLLGQWLASNSEAFEFFKKAVNKPYYWLGRKTEKPELSADYNCFAYIVLPELGPLRELNIALSWDAKVKAAKGQFQAAFEDIIDCYKAGSHKCRSNLLLIDQRNGLGIRKAAIEKAFLILDKSKSAIESKILKSFQDSLQTEMDNDTYLPSVEAEKFFLFDGLQWLFLDNSKGTGRLAWSVSFDYSSPCTDLTSNRPEWCSKLSNLKRRLNCFIGPTRNETAKKIEQTISISNQMMIKTPWQIKNEGRNYLAEIKNINNSNFFLELSTVGIDPKGIYYQYYNTKVRTEAMVTVLAILRFKVETGQFPETLNELISKNYLKAIPQDPYSNNPLIYKSSNENFKLYSVGPNFKDDEGIDESTDIIFWPVKEVKETESNK